MHFISYIPLGVLFSAFCAKCWYIVLLALNAMWMSVFLNKLVTFLTSGLWYMNIVHFLFCVCFSCFPSVVNGLFFCLAISFFFMSWIKFLGKPFFWAKVSMSMFFHSCFLPFLWRVMLSFCLCDTYMLLVCGPVGDLKCVELWYLH